MRTAAERNGGQWPFDAANAEVLDHKLDKLEKFVGQQCISSMAESIDVSQEQALDILVRVHVSMMGDLKDAVHSFADGGLLARVGPEKLCRQIEEVIAGISEATALDTEEITEIFSNNPSTDFEELSFRLHRRSLIDRSYTS